VMLTSTAPRVVIPRPDMPRQELYLHALHMVDGLGRRRQPVFFRERKISEYGEWTRWGVSRKRLAEYLFPQQRFSARGVASPCRFCQCQGEQARAHPAALSLLAVGKLAMLRRRKQPATGVSRQDGEAVYRTNVNTSGVLPVLYTNQYVGQHLRQHWQFFLATKITEYRKWTRWGVSLRGWRSTFLHTYHPTKRVVA